MRCAENLLLNTSKITPNHLYINPPKELSGYRLKPQLWVDGVPEALKGRLNTE